MIVSFLTNEQQSIINIYNLVTAEVFVNYYYTYSFVTLRL